MIPGELDSSALKGSVAFTGRLACMGRAEAFEVVRQHGGTPSQAVTKRTNLLIVGELGWPLLDVVVHPTSLLAQPHTASQW
jgi:BRCT domain type II-containing protein